MAKEIVLKDALENMGAQMVDRDLQAQEEQNNVKNIKIEVTLEELLLVTALLSDQLFRREFIDPKMPGYKGDPAELAMGKDLILRLKSMAREASGLAVAAASRRAPSHLSPKPNGIPDAI